METVSASLPIIAMWTAKGDGGGVYAITSSDCGPCFYLDMGVAGTAHFVKPAATIIDMTGFSRAERMCSSLGHVYILKEVTTQKPNDARPSRNMLVDSAAIIDATTERLLELTIRLERCLESINRFLSSARLATFAVRHFWHVALLTFGVWLGVHILRSSM